MGDNEAMRESPAWIAANIPRRMVEAALPVITGYVGHELRPLTVFFHENVDLRCEAHAGSGNAARAGGAAFEAQASETQAASTTGTTGCARRQGPPAVNQAVQARAGASAAGARPMQLQLH